MTSVLIVRRARPGEGREVCLFKTKGAALAYRVRFFHPRDVLFVGSLETACEARVLTPEERADLEHRLSVGTMRRISKLRGAAVGRIS